jgi:hypothetical protein
MRARLGLAVVAAIIGCWSISSSAAVRYDFNAFASLDTHPQLGAVSGAFSYIAPAAVSSDTTFATPGVHYTHRYTGLQAGKLIVVVLPEPAIWATVLLGLAALGVTIRIRHRAIQRLREKVLAEEEEQQPDELKTPKK